MNRFIGGEKVKERIISILKHTDAKSGAYYMTGFRVMGMTRGIRQALAEYNNEQKKEDRVRTLAPVYALKFPFKLALILILLNIGIAAQKVDLVIQRGHIPNARINGVFAYNIVNLSAFSIGGNCFASAGDDKTVRLWCLNPINEIRVFSGHQEKVTSLEFSRDEKLLLSGSWDKTIRLWNVADGSHKVINVNDNVSSLSLNPVSGHHLAVCGLNSAFIYDLKAEKILHKLELEEGFSCNKVKYNKDGNIIGGIISGLAVVWDANTGKVVNLFNDDEFESKTIAFTPDNTALVSGQQSGAIKFWDVKNDKLLHELKAHDEGDVKGVASIIFDSNGSRLLSAGTDGIIKFWTSAKQENKSGASGFEYRYTDKFATLKMVSEMTVNADFTKIVTSGYEGEIGLWDLAKKKSEHIFKGKSLTVNDLAINHNNNLLAIANDGFLYGVFLKGNNNLYLLGKRKGLPPVRSISLSRNADVLASCDWFSGILSYPVLRNQKLPLKGNSFFCGTVAFSPKDNIIAAAFLSEGKNYIQLEKIPEQGNNETTVIGTHNGGIDSLVFSPDGKTIASAGLDKTIKIWDVAAAAQLSTINLGLENVALTNIRISFSPDGKKIASSHPLKIWSVEVGKAATSLDAARAYSCVAFSPDGKLLASGRNDDTIVLWDVEREKELSLLNGHSGTVNALAFSSDGSKIISGSGDGTVKFWDTETGKELASLIVLDEKEWVVITPEGFFDGTPSAWKQVFWRFNNNTFDYAPLESFFNEFYRPELLQQVLDGIVPASPDGGIQNRDRRLPIVTLEQSLQMLGSASLKTSASVPARQNIRKEKPVRPLARVRIKVTEAAAGYDARAGRHMPAGGVKDLRLFRNGSLIRRWRGDIFNMPRNKGCRTIQPKNARSGRQVICSVAIPLVAGENNLTAYAFNNDNVKSLDAALQAEAKSLEQRRGKLYVLAIGINDYPVSKLTYAVSDAKQIGSEIEAHQERLKKLNAGQYAETRVIPLLNEHATRDNILLALRRLAGRNSILPVSLPSQLKKQMRKLQPVEPEDAILIFFSGHGLTDGEKFYLLPQNIPAKNSLGELQKKELDEVINASVSDIDLERELEEIDAGQILMIIDACYSGQLLESADPRQGPLNSQGLAQIGYEKGMYILTASQSYEAAVERTDLEHGVLTYALLEGLKSSAANLDQDDAGQIIEREWFDYAINRVRELHLQPKNNKNNAENKETKDEKSCKGIGGVDSAGCQRQVPRVFYRREEPLHPLIVSRSN